VDRLIFYGDAAPPAAGPKLRSGGADSTFRSGSDHIDTIVDLGGLWFVYRRRRCCCCGRERGCADVAGAGEQSGSPPVASAPWRLRTWVSGDGRRVRRVSRPEQTERPTSRQASDGETSQHTKVDSRAYERRDFRIARRAGLSREPRQCPLAPPAPDDKQTL